MTLFAERIPVDGAAATGCRYRMSTDQSTTTIDSLDELRTVYRSPSKTSLAKEVDHLDELAGMFPEPDRRKFLGDNCRELFQIR